jgi:hypothetical protein
MHARHQNGKSGGAFEVAALRALRQQSEAAQSWIGYLVRAFTPVTKLSADEREHAEPVRGSGPGECARQCELTAGGSNHQNSFVFLSSDT